MSKTFRTTVRIFGITSLSLISGTALASGYHQGIQSVSSQGSANSNAAEAADASVLFYNPAGITRLTGTNISGGLAVVIPNIELSDINATALSRTGNHKPIYGGDGNKPTSAVWVPQFYLSHQLDEQWFLGLAIDVPFGDKTNFQPEWMGRYNGTKLELMTVAINPSVAFKLDDHWSFGAGITAEYMDATFHKKIRSPTTLFTPRPTPSGDNQLRYEGDDWGYGYNLGATLAVDETLRFGAAYRSSIEQNLTGDMSLQYSSAIPSAYNPLSGQTVKHNGKVEIKTPDSFALNFYKQLNNELALTGDWTYTWHSRFHELTLNSLAIPASHQHEATINQDWQNTNRLSLGMSYQIMEPLKWRAGVAYDESPVPSAKERIANLPDSDRTWLSTGFNYAFSEKLSMDVAYTYVMFEDSKIDYTETDSFTNLKADVKTHANLLGVQLNYAI